MALRHETRRAGVHRVGATTSRPAAAARAPLPAAARAPVESLLGHDFSAVRVFSDESARTLTDRLGADAVTVGEEIAFAPRMLPWDTPVGRFAIAHELAHVGQLREMTSSPTPLTSARRSTLERHADTAARQATGLSLSSRTPAREPPSSESPMLCGVFEKVGDVRRDIHDTFAPFSDRLELASSVALSWIDTLNLGLPSQAYSLLGHLPMRVLRPLVAMLQGAVALTAWESELVDLLWNWRGVQPIIAHLIDGLNSVAAFVGEMLVYTVEGVGLAELLQALWAFKIVYPLDASHIAASQEVHPHGSIPYWMVKVDYDSIIARLSQLFTSYGSSSIAAQLLGTSGAGHRAVTTMHVIHTGPRPMSDELAVHELSHVMQYELIGAMYMPEAIHAQTQFGGRGYDYDNNPHGSLSAARAAGEGFQFFNREQQAQICEDYYAAKHGLATQKGGSLSDLEYFIDDLWGREMIPLYRNFGL